MTDRECAMTSRTNDDSAGQNLVAKTGSPRVDPEHRRQEAVQRYLDGDPIEQICQEMGCSKSWLYKWKSRYRVTEPDWSKPRSRRPGTMPSKTPEDVEVQILRLRQTLSPLEAGTVSARMIRDHLVQHAEASIPSLRTISRILHRHRVQGDDLPLSESAS